MEQTDSQSESDAGSERSTTTPCSPVMSAEQDSAGSLPSPAVNTTTMPEPTAVNMPNTLPAMNPVQNPKRSSQDFNPFPVPDSGAGQYRIFGDEDEALDHFDFERFLPARNTTTMGASSRHPVDTSDRRSESTGHISTTANNLPAFHHADCGVGSHIPACHSAATNNPRSSMPTQFMPDPQHMYMPGPIKTSMLPHWQENQQRARFMNWPFQSSTGLVNNLDGTASRFPTSQNHWGYRQLDQGNGSQKRAQFEQPEGVESAKRARTSDSMLQQEQGPAEPARTEPKVSSNPVQKEKEGNSGAPAVPSLNHKSADAERQTESHVASADMPSVDSDRTLANEDEFAELPETEEEAQFTDEEDDGGVSVKTTTYQDGTTTTCIRATAHPKSRKRVGVVTKTVICGGEVRITTTTAFVPIDGEE